MWYIHPFINKEYADAHPKGMLINWWMVYCANDYLLISVHVVLVIMAQKISSKLATIASIYLIYHLFDHFFLWYDYKTNHSLYLIENMSDIFCVIVLLWPMRKDPKLKIVKK